MIPVNHTISTDGTGLWSTKIADVRIIGFDFDVLDEPGSEAIGELRMYFDPSTWNPRSDGFIYTDEGFIKGVEDYFCAFGLPADHIFYSEHGMQGENFVSFDITTNFAKALADKVPEILKSNDLGGEQELCCQASSH